MIFRNLLALFLSCFCLNSLSARWIRCYNNDRCPVLVEGEIINGLSYRDIEINDTGDILHFRSIDGSSLIQRMQQIRAHESVVTFSVDDRNQLICTMRPELYQSIKRGVCLLATGYWQGLTLDFGMFGRTKQVDGMSYEEAGTQACGVIAGVGTLGAGVAAVVALWAAKR